MAVCIGPGSSQNINPDPPGAMSSQQEQSPASVMKPPSLTHPASLYPPLPRSYPPSTTTSPRQPPHQVQETEAQIGTYMDRLAIL